MSYCRALPGVSDVYLYHNDETIVCNCCRLTVSPGSGTPPEDRHFDSPLEALDHLQEHLTAKHLVPVAAFVQLRAEARERGLIP